MANISGKADRLLLQSELERYFDDDNRVIDPSNHVSFQPDEHSKIVYPHIVYVREPQYAFHADSLIYRHMDKYKVTIIDRNPDSLVFDKLSERILCKNTTNFVSDGLNHFVFDLYY